MTDLKPARRDTPEGRAPETLLEISDVRQTYPRGKADHLLVLEGVDMTLRAGEIVGLLGRSGAGKSSLLRIIAGLSRPASGEVKWRGVSLRGPIESIAMVFQSFALFPWLTVQQNVELGLESLGLAPDERRARSLQAIDLIGLDGFENAYPKELSGGMRQRVGFARAIVMQPELLLMDEPFSALDVLTAETLRTDLIELWMEGKLPLRSILMVSHNIEEAILMCDRIIIFAANPGRVAAEIKIDLKHPRHRDDPAFRALVDEVYVRMTRPDAARAAEQAAAHAAHGGMGIILPEVSPNTLAGLMETLAGDFSGKADLPELADDLSLEVDELFPLTETLQLFGFAEVAHGDIRLTQVGKRFVDSDSDARKKMFGEQLVARVPIAALIRRVLDERPTHRAPYRRFSEELEDFMSEEAAEETMGAVITWGRYAELFAWDEQAETFTLEDPA